MIDQKTQSQITGNSAAVATAFRPTARPRLDGDLKIRSLTMDDKYTGQGKPEDMYAENDLNAGGIVRSVFQALGRDIKEAIEAGEIA